MDAEKERMEVEYMGGKETSGKSRERRNGHSKRTRPWQAFT